MIEAAKAYVEFCTGKGIEVNKTRIEINVKALKASGYTGEQIAMAVGRMFRKTKWFPDCSEVIGEIESYGVTSKDIASLSAQKVINTIHECGFDPLKIKAEIGEQNYEALGGAMAIQDYGAGEMPRGVLLKQLGDRLAALNNVKKSTGKAQFPEFEKSTKQIAGKELSRIDFHGGDL